MIAPDWKASALRTVRRMRGPFLIEKIRHLLARRNIHAPKPNSWGWLTTWLLRAKLIRRVETKVSTDKRNHSRVWEFEVVRG